MSLALEDEWSRVDSTQNPEHQVITYGWKWTKDMIVGIPQERPKEKEYSQSHSWLAIGTAARKSIKSITCSTSASQKSMLSSWQTLRPT